jgi:hypothetical protein
MKYTYKIILVSSLLGFLVIFSCRKKELVEEAENYVYGAEHCFNGQLDNDEVYIDCGGACRDCDEVISPCAGQLGNNTIIIKMFQKSTSLYVVEDTLLISNIVKNQNGNNITYTGTTSNGIDIEIKLDDLTSENYPNIFISFFDEYTIEDSPNFTYRDASLKLFSSSSAINNYGWNSASYSFSSDGVTSEGQNLYFNSYTDGSGNTGESISVCDVTKYTIYTTNSSGFGNCNLTISLNLIYI